MIFSRRKAQAMHEPTSLEQANLQQRRAVLKVAQVPDLHALIPVLRAAEAAALAAYNKAAQELADAEMELEGRSRG